MRAGLTVLLVLSMTCGWPAPSVAQNPVISYVGPPQELDPASIPKKLLWAWTMLIKPANRHKPIPLYGYPMSRLDDNTALHALSVAAAGNVHIARLCERIPEDESETDERIFDGRGLRVAGTAEDANQPGLTEAWAEFRNANGHCAGDTEPVIAFTRPLDVRPANSTEILDAMEFVAWPELWNERTASVSTYDESDEPS